ncbi:MAG: hypothetical protein M1822_007631 [Bathelium mastoideum]|nr:MAG: hypothetical protein M1822_007631 [Bathelium mastoideum]
MRGYIRVLQLRAGSFENPDIECELIVQAFDKDKRLEQRFEALSWCWGTAKPTKYLSIHKNKKVYAKWVNAELFSALKALRHPKEHRFLWIDAVSINQESPQEKNHQVEMMAEIYGHADQVCVWLGDGDEASHMALNFIRKEVLQLQNFDELCESELASEKWGALLNLMQRPWFSRRWVVQEISLARKATIYCGNDQISWKKFAVAVELFVEVETATHRLSEVMKKDPKFYHVPGWFEYVSALGASLLVEATGKLFRDYKPSARAVTSETSHDSDDDELENIDDLEIRSDSSESSGTGSSTSSDDEQALILDTAQRANKGQALLSLEYLVSSLSIFEVTVPHDAIYTLLAIAKDTIPAAGDDGPPLIVDHAQETLEGFTQKKRYKVDYTQHFSDVCKEFVQFCIDHSDPRRALDIICRPWAPEIPHPSLKQTRPRASEIPNPSPQRTRLGAMDGPNTQLQRNKTMTTKDSMATDKTTSNHGRPVPTKAAARETRTLEGDSAQEQARKEAAQNRKSKDIPLPSWIPQLSGAAYAMLPQAGVHTLKMARKNADSLVGLPTSSQNYQQNYNAAETKGIDFKVLCFKKRVKMKHHSLYAKGFVLDTISELQPSSQGGAIPSSWARAGAWRNAPHSDPPDAFWRTLVADRGRDGRNPPVYYSRACKESFVKGGLSSGSVNTTDLISNERCSVVAQFCRRVQAVIWNRRLIKTQTGRLGLASQHTDHDDIIAILYGCSVPVVLRRKWKTRDEVEQEIKEDVWLWKENLVRTWLAVCKARQARRAKRADLRVEWKEWDGNYREKWRNDETWSNNWKSRLNAEQARQKQMDKSAPVATEKTWSEKQDDPIGNCVRNHDESEEDHKRRMQAKSYEFYKRGKKAEAVDKDIPWAEPRPRWHEFELFLKFGRRWKTVWTRTNELNLAKEQLAETQRKDKVTVAMAKRRLSVVRTDDQGTKKKRRKLLSDVEATQRTIRLAAQDRLTVLQNVDHKIQNSAKERLADLRRTNKPLYMAAGDNKSALRLRNAKEISADDDDNLPPDLASSTQVNGAPMVTSSSEAAEAANGAPNTTDDTNGMPQDGAVDAYMDTLKESLARKFKLKPEDGLQEPEPNMKPEDNEELQRIKQNWCYYEVLGEAYVHGMMDGEAMAFQNEKVIKAQVFELR